MSRSINPLAKLVASISESFSNATNRGQASLPSQTSAASKDNLDKAVGAFGGNPQTGLNSYAPQSKYTSNTAMGGNKTVNSGTAGSVDKLRSVSGSTSNIAADIAGTINKLTGGNLGGGLLNAAAGISGAAGMLNNLLSKKRGANIPAGAQTYVQQGQGITLQAGSKDDWRVRITCDWNLFHSQMMDRLKDTGGVVWPYLPNITVSTKADYTAVTPVHSNYALYSYKNSSVETITIAGDFSCETEEDAAYWIAATTFFKTATKMFFGVSEKAGNPPLICNLSGYGSSVFDRIPIVITSFSVDLKDDVNYIRCDKWGTNTWVPVLSTVSVQVVPIYSREKLRSFDIQDYARGRMASADGESNVGFM
jgi:hypothetical protein